MKPFPKPEFSIERKIFARNAKVNKYVVGDVIRTNNLQFTNLYFTTGPPRPHVKDMENFNDTKKKKVRIFDLLLIYNCMNMKYN